MKVSIDRGECFGSGLCNEYAPEVFGHDENDIVVLRKLGEGAVCASCGSEVIDASTRTVEVPVELESTVRSAARDCPVNAIQILE